MTSTGTVRFGVSLEPELRDRFDRYLAERGYASRSEALRDLVREALAQHAVEHHEGEVVGTLTLLYDHHAPGLAEKLVSHQHHHHHHHTRVLTTTHIHVDHRNCLEVLVLRGPAERVRELAHALRALKGVQQGQLVCTPVEAGDSPSGPSHA